MGDDLDLAIPNLLDVDIVAEIARAAFDLDAIVQELLERAEVEDLVADGLGAVDRVLVRDLRALRRLPALRGASSLLRSPASLSSAERTRTLAYCMHVPRRVESRK
jgi:hypothetical protein